MKNKAGRQRLYKALIGVILVLIPISASMILYGSLQEDYNTASGYNNTRLQEQRENLEAIQNQTRQTTKSLRDLQQNPSVADLLGSILISAYGAFTQLGAVIDFIFQLIAGLVGLLPFGPIGNTVTAVLLFSVNAWFFIGFLGNVLTKSDRT